MRRIGSKLLKANRAYATSALHWCFECYIVIKVLQRQQVSVVCRMLMAAILRVGSVEEF